MHPEKAILNIMNNSYISYRLQNGLFFCKRYQIYHNQMLIKKKHIYSALFHLESLLCLCSLLMIFAFREELRFTLLQFFAFFCCNEFFNQGSKKICENTWDNYGASTLKQEWYDNAQKTRILKVSPYYISIALLFY